MTDIEKILSKIDQSVTFTYPEPGVEKHGILKDRNVIEGGYVGSVFYWDIVDLIDFEGEDELMIRIGYYRKKQDRLVFAGQTTITEPLSTWKRILLETAQKKPWFRTLLEDVVAELDP